MSRIAIADTGLLYASLDPDDQHHAWAIGQLQRYPRFLTCEAVIGEVVHLTGSRLNRPADVFAMIERGAVGIGFSLLGHEARVIQLMRQYADRPIDFADACLVVMSEQLPGYEVITVDSDFRFYQRFGNQAIPAVLP